MSCCVAPVMGRPQRLAGFDYHGRISVMISASTHQRHTAFADDIVCTFAERHLLTLAAAWKIEVTAYCFMPEHVHLLLTGVANDTDILGFAKAWKQRTGYHYARQHARPLWQGNYWDDVLREPTDVPFFIAYVVNNPVDARLVERAEHYRWFGSSGYTREELLEIAREVSLWTR